MFECAHCRRQTAEAKAVLVEGYTSLVSSWGCRAVNTSVTTYEVVCWRCEREQRARKMGPVKPEYLAASA